MRRALALGAGALVALSLPPWGWWPLAFVGIALFEVSLGREPARRERAALGFLFGAGWLFPGMGWMWFLTAPGYVVAGTAFAALHAAAAAAAPTGPWRIIGRPAAHALVEALRLFVPFGGVPLATLAIGQASGPLLGVARIGGVILISWAVFQIGVVLGVAVEAALERRRPERIALASLGAVAGVCLLAIVAPEGDALGSSLRVAAVQGGGPQGTLAIRTKPGVVLERHLVATRTIAPGSADLVVWPENVIDVDEFSTSQALVDVAAEAKRIGAPMAVGITEDVPVSDDLPVGGFLNAQVIVTPDGDVTSRYDKVRRVPFGEYMPLRDLLRAIGAPTDQVPRDAIAGTGPAVLDLPTGERMGVVISWEVFFGGRARDGVRHGGELIVNPTNGSSYTGTILQTQQVASSRLRAVETGRWVVQVAPTGFSAFVSSHGDVIDRTAVSEQAVIAHVVPLRSGSTWYTSLGDLPFVLLCAVTLALAMGLGRRVTPPAAP